METGPVGVEPTADPTLDALASLTDERDRLARRCTEAEATVDRLSAELAEARATITAWEESAVDPDSLSLFDGAEASGGDDGSDPRVLSAVLGATAVVAGLVTLLTLINGNLFTVFGMLMLAATIGLAWAAASTRVIPVEVSVTRGMVYVEQGETSYRFDLRKPETAVQVTGQPGDADWSVRFERRHLDPFVITASMVDATEFMRQVREFRPEL